MFSITGRRVGKTSRLASENKLSPFPFSNYHTLPLPAKSGAQECACHVVPLNSPKNEYPQKPKSFKSAKIFQTTRRPVISSTSTVTQAIPDSELMKRRKTTKLNSNPQHSAGMGLMCTRLFAILSIALLRRASWNVLRLSYIRLRKFYSTNFSQCFD